jgi:hypothetical protein
MIRHADKSGRASAIPTTPAAALHSLSTSSPSNPFKLPHLRPSSVPVVPTAPAADDDDDSGASEGDGAECEEECEEEEEEEEECEEEEEEEESDEGGGEGDEGAQGGGKVDAQVWSSLNRLAHSCLSRRPPSLVANCVSHRGRWTHRDLPASLSEPPWGRRGRPCARVRSCTRD